MHILTIHGIRRQKKWYYEFQRLPYWKNTQVKIDHFEYGYLPLFQFLNPFRRAKVIEDFQEFYSTRCDLSKPPCIICHSFGTYIFYQSIKEHDSIKFDKVILCGSILSAKTQWKNFFDLKQIKLLYNDYGVSDWVVKFSTIILRGCGLSGQKGFSDIPNELSSKIIQRKKYTGHSGYFYPPHMTENWAKILAPPNLQRNSRYKPSILRDEIIERVYKNICTDFVKYSKITYRARVDERGNYFAHYTKEGYNCGQNDLTQLPFVTTSDSTSSQVKMWFRACDLKNKSIDSYIDEDAMQNKSFIISFPNSIKPTEQFGIQLRFRLKETMTINESGDTDHFAIKDADDVLISLNYKYRLVSPKFLILKDKGFVGEIVPELKTEKDGTSTYLIQYRNVDNNDGIIFYFESSIMPDTIITSNKKSFRYTKARKKPGNTSFPSKGVSIDKCTLDLIPDVYHIEHEIEFTNAASETILKQRLAMFPDGFLVAKENDKIVGYIESVIWNDFDFETFKEIEHFPLRYDSTGDTLYVIFLGVQHDKRRQGIGETLIHEIEKVALKYELGQIKLVAKDDLVHYYGKFGFREIRELPHFLEDREYKSVLMVKEMRI